MNRLDDIGFYTMRDARCANASATSPIWRAELVLSDRCNFACSYCRGLKKALCGDMLLSSAKGYLDLLIKQGLKNVRFSGGEPTLYSGLPYLIRAAKEGGVERIAVSTNGSASMNLYQELLSAGVNDLSVSLDACCAATGDKMAGRRGSWNTVVENIRALAPLVYVTIGIVLAQDNEEEVERTIEMVHDFGVADIRVIPAAQLSRSLCKIELSPGIIDKHPILKYRLSNHTVRGLSESDNRRCPLILDDLAIAGDKHFPCIIYLREQGDSIGTMGPNFRQEREQWMSTHDCYTDNICRNNCLDTCVAYNNRWLELKKYNLPRMDSSLFDWQSWRIGSSFEELFGEKLRWSNIISKEVFREKIRTAAIGWCPGEQLPCRPKENCNAVMFNLPEGTGWVHLRRDEFYEIWK